MEAFYSSIGLSIVAETKIKYGKEDEANSVWKKIINIKDADERNKKIDTFISLMEKNNKENGFIGRDEVVKINGLGNAFKLDDNQLYYLFFDTLKILKENNPNEPDSRILFHGIKSTIKNYFGGLGSNRQKRMILTSIEISDDDIKIPSISLQRGENCSLCAERASVAHNLWLLTGTKSHYVNSSDCNFGSISNEYINDGHAFCVVEIDRAYKLFDLTMQVYKKLDDNPIDKMLKGESFKITTKDGEEYTYANATPKYNR